MLADTALDMDKTLEMENATFLPVVCQLAAEGKEVSIRAKGNSMRPFVESGRDIAILAKCETWRKGDVALAETAPGHYVLHRIDGFFRTTDRSPVSGPVCARQADTGVRMRGDGNPRGVELCKVGDLHARCVAFVRKGKRVNLDESRCWAIYSKVWPALLPVRRLLLALYRLLWLGQWPDRLKRRKQLHYKQ